MNILEAVRAARPGGRIWQQGQPEWSYRPKRVLAAMAFALAMESDDDILADDWQAEPAK